MKSAMITRLPKIVKHYKDLDVQPVSIVNMFGYEVLDKDDAVTNFVKSLVAEKFNENINTWKKVLRVKGINEIHGMGCFYVGEAEYTCYSCAAYEAGIIKFSPTYGYADVYKTVDGDIFVDTEYVMLDSRVDFFDVDFLPRWQPAKRGKRSTSRNKIRKRMARPFVKTDDDELPF